MKSERRNRRSSRDSRLMLLLSSKVSDAAIMAHRACEEALATVPWSFRTLRCHRRMRRLRRVFAVSLPARAAKKNEQASAPASRPAGQSPHSPLRELLGAQVAAEQGPAADEQAAQRSAEGRRASVGSVSAFETVDLNAEDGGSEEAARQRRQQPPKLSPVACASVQLQPPRPSKSGNAASVRFRLDGSAFGLPPAEFHGDEGGPAEPQGGASSEGVEMCEVALRDIIRTDGDPDAIGYTLTEAMTLSRSAMPQQRAAAMGLIANVLRRAHIGIAGAQEAAPGVTWAEARVLPEF